MVAAADNVFRALADQTRRRAVAILAEHELSVSELVWVLDQPQSTVSRHLRILRDALLIRDRRDGTTVMYSLAAAPGLEDAATPAGLTEWLSKQPLPEAVRKRLEEVLRRRGDMSRRFFDAVGRQWDTLREESFGSQFQLEAFIGLLPTNWTVADIGTGTGYLLPVLARHFRKIIGVEPSARMITAAGKRVGQERLTNVELRSGELEQLPISTSGVDLAVMMLVLHHVASPVAAVAELRRVIRDGGAVLLVEQYEHESDSFRQRMQDRWTGFPPDDLVVWFETLGFSDCRFVKLATTRPADDAPELFAVTGRRNAALDG